MTRGDMSIDDMQAEDMAEILLEAVQNGATLKDLQGVPQDLMDDIYAFAYRFYQQGRLDHAEVFFRFLCIYDFYNAEYVMGLAAVRQLRKDYAKAIDLYALAYALSKDDCRPMFHTGQCHLMMGKAALARRSFGVVAERSTDDHLRRRALSYLHGLDEVGAAEQTLCTAVAAGGQE
jgi:type III secretion system low calcium response chaperone LcrH/SycD